MSRSARFHGAIHPEWNGKLRGPSGRHLCKGCLVEVKPPRLLWCGAACVDRHMLATSGSLLRRAVRGRDGGICALCGVDARFTGGWDADHIVPVCEGGRTELSNIRTLCKPCHKAETRKLAARRAVRRKESA